MSQLDGSAGRVISNSYGIYSGTYNNPNSILSGDLGQFFTNDENNNYTTSAPKAFLNWVAFDNQLNEVSANSGVVQVPTISAGVQAQPLVAPEQIIQKDGYIYIYVSNESAQKVFFDNLVVHHNRGPILQTDSYYPFGLTMAGISDQAALSKENNYLFNGKLLNHKEFSDNTGLDWYSYGMREYDPQIGRFFRVDLLASKFPYYSPYQFAGNEVPNAIDLDGLEPLSAKYLTLYQNKVNGELGEQFVKTNLETTGDYEIYQRVTTRPMNTEASSNTVNDFLLKSKSSNYYTVEVKTGGGKVRENQVIHDDAVGKGDLIEMRSGKESIKPTGLAKTQEFEISGNLRVRVDLNKFPPTFKVEKVTINPNVKGADEILNLTNDINKGSATFKETKIPKPPVTPDVLPEVTPETEDPIIKPTIPDLPPTEFPDIP